MHQQMQVARAHRIRTGAANFALRVKKSYARLDVGFVIIDEIVDVVGTRLERIGSCKDVKSINIT
jgi:hypothetical protein